MLEIVFTKLWPALIQRTNGYVERIPAEGVSRGQFIADVLFDVDPRDCEEIVDMLARRRIVWLSRYRGEVTVYGAMPKARAERELVGSKPMDRFFGELGLLLLDAHDRAEALRVNPTNREAHEGSRIAFGRIVALCRRKAADGLSLADMRAAMWSVVAPAIMAPLGRFEPSLAREANGKAFPEEQPKPRRLPNGLDVRGKVLALVERAGPKGITKTEVLQRVRPLMTALEIGDVIGGLESEGAIVWTTIRSGGAGRPGVRLFASEVGLPGEQRVTGDWYPDAA